MLEPRAPEHPPSQATLEMKALAFYRGAGRLATDG